MTIQIGGATTLLQVFDMPRSVAFYCDVLGFRIVATSAPGNHFDWAMLRLGEAALMLNTAYEDDERPASPCPTRVAAHADTVLFFECSNADDVYAQLRSKGWKAQEPVSTRYGMRQVYTSDPDEFQLCFQHPVNPDHSR